MAIRGRLYSQTDARLRFPDGKSCGPNSFRPRRPLVRCNSDYCFANFRLTSMVRYRLKMNEVIGVGLSTSGYRACVVVVRRAPVVLGNRHVEIGIDCLDVSNVPVCKPRAIADPLQKIIPPSFADRPVEFFEHRHHVFPNLPFLPWRLIPQQVRRMESTDEKIDRVTDLNTYAGKIAAQLKARS
jgi:hypothetical protein